MTHRAQTREGIHGVRRTDAALVAATLIAAGGLGFAVWPQATPTAAVDPATVRIDRPTLESAGLPTALIISDGYTSGSGLAEASYGCLTATRLGWLCKTASEPETGFVSGGPTDRFPLNDGSGQSTSFGERITPLGKIYRPDVVILDGGRNDVFAEPGARFDGIARTVYQVRQTWPAARIVFVAPRFLAEPGDDLGIDGDVIDELRKASGADNLIVVDPIAGFEDIDTAPLISRDGTNPNRAGERALADALAEALSRRGVRPTT